MRLIPILLCSTLLSLSACVAGPRQVIDGSHKPLAEQQRDAVECSALASQAAQGAGAWSSSYTIRAASFDVAREQALYTCLESRGWRWVTTY